MQLAMLVALRCLLHRCSSQDNHHRSWRHQRKWKILRWWKLWHKHQFGMREWSLCKFADVNLVMTSLSSQWWGSPNFGRNVAQSWTHESEPTPFYGIWWTGAWAPQPNVRFIPHRQHCSPKNGRRRVVTCPWEFTEVTTGPYPSKIESKSRTTRARFLCIRCTWSSKLFNATYREGNFRKTDRHRLGHRHRHRWQHEDNKTRSHTINTDWILHIWHTCWALWFLFQDGSKETKHVVRNDQDMFRNCRWLLRRSGEK